MALQRSEDQTWELTTNPSRSDRERNYSSSASSSSKSSDEKNSNGSQGRRARPSVASISSQLATVREQKEQRALSWENENKMPGTSRLDSDETILSSKKVLTDFRRVAVRDLERDKKRQEKLGHYRAENAGQRDVYERLRDWADSHIKRSKSVLPSWAILGTGLKPLPKTEELLLLARHHYPPRVSSQTPIAQFFERLMQLHRDKYECKCATSAKGVLSILKSLLGKLKSVRSHNDWAFAFGYLY